MSKSELERIKNSLIEQAENLFGKERTVEIREEIETMAEHLAILRATPVDLQDEP